MVRGAWEAGVKFASAYPGTPSTEILESMTERKEVKTEWAPNEKVAVEAAIGASIAGVRSMASMKHVGLNVAADSLFTYAYTGVNAGFVLVTADEPGQHSSQNEQDNRNYAKAAKIPMLEPSTSQEAKNMMRAAFAMSEVNDTPVLIRVTTRVCHSKGIVECGDRKKTVLTDYKKDVKKYLTVPAFVREMRKKVEERMTEFADYSNHSPFNKIYDNQKQTGVIASGQCYCYAKEVFGDDVNYLKLGFTNPLPDKLISRFCKGHGAQIAFDIKNEDKRVVSVLGDSTFFHTGINSLIEVLYNQSKTVNIILDNRITGMTGHQENPGSGRHADLSEAPVMEIEPIVRALGARNVKTIDPNDLTAVKETLDWALELGEPSVIITRWPCVLKKLSQQDQAEFKDVFKAKCRIEPALCVGCKVCLKAGCPALSVDPDVKKAMIDGPQCVGCGICAQLCAKKAIVKEERYDDKEHSFSRSRRTGNDPRK